jgi:thiamine biosynthesis lipoprotein
VSDAFVLTANVMDTVVSLQIVGPSNRTPSAAARAECEAAARRALAWYVAVEACCTRFDPASELRQLSACAGEPLEVSAILFETVRFAVALAEETDGAFDPTVGQRMEAAGFDREYRTGRRAPSGVVDRGATYRDIVIDEDRRTLTLERPLVLDLGAVAKGFAIDMAARELAPFGNYAVDAGGDLYVAGHNASGEPWSVGIRHPRAANDLLETLYLSDTAVCTSGDYERRSIGGAPHILDPRPSAPRTTAGVASATVIAPLAMVADGLATAAFVLGPRDGISLLERHGVRGIIVTPSLERFTTRDI